ncbi:MAG: NAD(P)H-hydrate dehydratase [Paracoccaceae bacterium]
MTALLTAAQMRAIEKAAIDRGEVTGLELMERAGCGVIDAVFEEWPELRTTSHRAVVLCGPGNNGGDGFVVARLLKDWGWAVEVFLYGTPEQMPPDARVNYERWVAMGEVKKIPLDPFAGRPPFMNNEHGLFVDALFGIGLSRCLSPDLVGALSMMDHGGTTAGWRRVALDVPSGLCADSGRPLKDGAGRSGAIRADLTVTFHGMKIGHLLSEGPHQCGKIVLRDIGLHGKRGDVQASVSMSDYITHDPSIVQKAEGHKFSHGHALIESGDHGRSGAARLAARGALRIGAGVVTLASPPAAMAENAARLDAIMLREVAGAEDLARVLADTRINALCLGPGMGTGPAQADLVAVALGDPRPQPLSSEGEGSRLVLDADALTILSQRPDLFAALHGNCVLTPHAGEFARLFPDIAAKLAAPATKGPAYSKVDATREAAARARCVVLFKGPDTVIADPFGRCAINAAVYDRAAPWLATAGSGDVLAGFITGLLARGFSPFDAACTGAWVHVECARSFGPGLIAEDLPEELPSVFRSLGL